MQAGSRGFESPQLHSKIVETNRQSKGSQQHGLRSAPATARIERSCVETRQHGIIFQDPKTFAGIRTLALPNALTVELRSHLSAYVDDEPDALVFTAAHSGATPTKMVWRRAWDTARTTADVDCTFHDLRHVAGTLNAAAGATIKEATARLGHSFPDAAVRYQHAIAERDSEIAKQVDALLDGLVLDTGREPTDRS